MPALIEIIETLTRRLPELEYRLDDIGKIRCADLPRGLFRSGQSMEWMTSLACIEEIRADLARLKTGWLAAEDQASPVVFYLAKQMSLKMQVLLQLCQQHRRKKSTSTKAGVAMKQLVTRQQWLDTVVQERERLLLQQSALQSAMGKEKTHAASTLGHALSDVESQLASLQQMLSTLTGAI